MAPTQQQQTLERFVETGKKVIGAGLNYKSFAAKEKLPHPVAPVVFLKATSSYLKAGRPLQVPAGDQVNAEVELGVVIGRTCSRVSEQDAPDFVGGYCLALDMTNITLLNKLRASSGPWALAKAFDSACPVSDFIPKDKLPTPQMTRIWMKVNGELKQDESTSDMIFPIAHLVSYISHYMTLEPGDVILTGTPAGPCPLRPGDAVECGLDSVHCAMQLNFNVEAAPSAP
ncbi:acylpyruvase FAHD1, mitochondrial-like [Thrips palmi]|uniref:oxaloacetate tautomerase n=1 Tax=Thrips palmi TaxID=161013 RepID=A0A6P8Y9L3_THRPL|nr:acylpyruvase FAHD1, mitochondrial-like [Thrips palmi]